MTDEKYDFRLRNTYFDVFADFVDFVIHGQKLISAPVWVYSTTT